MKDLYERVCDGILDVRATAKEPSFLIVDGTTFEEMKTDHENAVIKPLKPTSTGYRYRSLVVAVVADTGENIRIVKVV